MCGQRVNANYAPHPRALPYCTLAAGWRYCLNCQIRMTGIEGSAQSGKCGGAIHATCFLEVGWGPCADSCIVFSLICTRMA